jgi:RND family efflux transporter MFP subunit
MKAIRMRKSSACAAAAVFLLAGTSLMLWGCGSKSDSASAPPAAAADQSSSAPQAQPQLWTCGMHPQVIQDHPGICPICHMKLTPLKMDDEYSSGAGAKQKKIAYWWDPMLGPPSISNHPGKSAMGMDLVPVYESEISAGPSIRIDPTVVQNMGVTTAPVVRGPLTATVRAVGVLQTPEPALHDVTLRISGYIEKLYADTEGMSVSKGDPLFELYSPDLQLAEQELIGAEQNLKALDANANQTAREDAQNLVESAEQKLRFWDVAERDIDTIAAAAQAPKTVPFRSPTDGDVVDKMVVDGSAVQAGMKVMRIEDHSRLWLDAQVYESQIPMVKIGEEVNATMDSVPGRTFSGKVMFIYPHVDHMSRTELVRTTLNNSDHQLKPGMYATAEIMTQPAPDAILAPREAVIDTGTKQIVFVMDPNSAGHFEPRNVRVGMSGDDDKVQIVEGLAPGDQVVTSGQFLMDVESRTTEAIEKLRGASMVGMNSMAPKTQPAPGTELIHSMTPTSSAQ